MKTSKLLYYCYWHLNVRTVYCHLLLTGVASFRPIYAPPTGPSRSDVTEGLLGREFLVLGVL